MSRNRWSPCQELQPRAATTEQISEHSFFKAAMSESRLRIKTLIMVLAMVVCANVGDLLLKRGMGASGAVQFSPSGLSHALLWMMTSATIWLGILFLLGFMTTQMTVMSWADYSYVMPAGAFGYALQTLMAVLILHET